MTTGTTPAETPASTDTTTSGGDTGTATIDTGDEIVDLDAADYVPSEPGSDIEDGSLESSEEAVVEEPAETPAEIEAKTTKEKLSGAQRAKIQRQALLDQIAERDRELATLRPAAKVEPAPGAGAIDPNMPKEEDFNGNYFAFTEARAAYVAGKAAKEAAEAVFKTREVAANQQQDAARQAIIDLDHAERVDAAKSVITDYDDVMAGMKGVNVSDSLIGLIKASENSAVIAYKLAQDPALLGKLDKMTPLQQAREIGRLEVTEKLPEPKKVTSAPPPLSKSKGAAPAAKSQEAQLSAWLDKKYGPDRKR